MKQYREEIVDDDFDNNSNITRYSFSFNNVSFKIIYYF